MIRQVDSLIQKKEWMVQLRILADLEERKELIKKEPYTTYIRGALDVIDLISSKIERKLEDEGCYKWIKELEKDECI